MEAGYYERRQWEWICVRDTGRKHVQFDADEWRELEASVRSATGRGRPLVCGACSHACAMQTTSPLPTWMLLLLLLLL